MIIKLQGFELEINAIKKAEGSEYSLNSFYTDLNNPGLNKNRFIEYDRILCVDNDKHPKYALGLLVTIKDEKKYCAYNDKGGVLSIKDIGKDESLAEFNYFVINKNTNAGIYQYYQNSLSLNRFLTFIQSNYDVCRTDDKSQRSLDATPLYKHGTFIQLLNKFDEIKNVRMNFSTYINKKETGIADAGRPTRETESRLISFSKGGKKWTINYIKDLYRSHRDKKFSAKVFDQKINAYRTISELNNIDDFGAYDYKDISSDFNLDLENFADSAILNTLIEKAEEEPIINSIKKKK